MLLADVVETSTTVSATRSRLAKIDALASLLAPCPGRRDRRGHRLPRRRRAARPHRYRLGDAARPRRREQRRAGPDHRRCLEHDRCRARRHRSRFGRAPDATSSTALFARATPAEADFLRRLLLGELRQGALEGVMTDAIARASGRPASRRAARRDVERRPAHHRAPRAHRWRGRARGDRARRAATDPADARGDLGRRDAGARRDRPRLGRVEARRRAHPGAPRRRRGARVHPEPQRRHRTAPRGRRRGAQLPGAHPDPRRRSDRRRRGRTPRPLPGHDEPLRAPAARRARASR